MKNGLNNKLYFKLYTENGASEEKDLVYIDEKVIEHYQKKYPSKNVNEYLRLLFILLYNDNTKSPNNKNELDTLICKWIERPTMPTENEILKVSKGTKYTYKEIIEWWELLGN